MDNLHLYDIQKYHESKVRELPGSMKNAHYEYEQAPIQNGVGRLVRGLIRQLASWAQAQERGNSPSRLQQTQNKGSS